MAMNPALSIRSLLLGASLLPLGASALSITGLRNTGVDASGNPNVVGTVEGNYAVTLPATAVNPAGYNPADYTIRVVNRPGSWVANPSDARWIGPTLTANESAGTTDPDNNSDPYVYSLTFDLTGLNPDTAALSGQWASDNGSTIWLNGANTGLSVAGFGSLVPFSITDGMAGGTVQFLPGLNTLEFRVINSVQASGNPSGLLVSGLAGTANAIPDGGPTLAFLGIALGAVAAASRLARKA